MNLKSYITEKSVSSYRLNMNQREELIQLLNDIIYDDNKYFKKLNKLEQSILDMFYDTLSDKRTYRTIDLNMFDSNELEVLKDCLQWIDENDLWDDTTEAVDVLDALENIL